MEILENKPLLERKFFLMRGLESHNVTQEEYDAEVPELDRQIKENLANNLVQLENDLREQIVEARKNTVMDGDLKRKVALILHKILADQLDSETIKGVFRAGYKISRGR